jgi:hypothetical protein
MTVDDFIDTQRQLIADGDFDGYLPTLWVETPRHVKVNVLVDAPGGEELESVAREWAQQMARKHDYCLAFKADDSRLKVVARIGGLTSERVVPVAAA